MKDDLFGKVSKRNAPNKKSKRLECFCCGTKKREIVGSGVFPCSHCFDSFPELEKDFPEQFSKNLKEIEHLMKITEFEEEIYKQTEWVEKNKKKIDKKEYDERIRVIEKMKESLKDIKNERP